MPDYSPASCIALNVDLPQLHLGYGDDEIQPHTTTNSSWGIRSAPVTPIRSFFILWMNAMPQRHGTRNIFRRKGDHQPRRTVWTLNVQAKGAEVFHPSALGASRASRCISNGGHMPGFDPASSLSCARARTRRQSVPPATKYTAVHRSEV